MKTLLFKIKTTKASINNDIITAGYPSQEIEAIKKRDYSNKLNGLTIKKTLASIVYASITIVVLYGFITTYMVILD